MGSGLGVLHAPSVALFGSVLVVAALSVGVLVMVRRESYRMGYILAALLISGIGNLIDRVIYGGVCDYFVLPGITIFNLNDISITSCIMVLIYEIIRHKNN